MRTTLRTRLTQSISFIAAALLAACCAASMSSLSSLGSGKYALVVSGNVLHYSLANGVTANTTNGYVEVGQKTN